MEIKFSGAFVLFRPAVDLWHDDDAATLGLDQRAAGRSEHPCERLYYCGDVAVVSTVLWAMASLKDLRRTETTVVSGSK